MELDALTEQLETISAAYAQRFGVKRTADWFLLKLTEELGELIQSYLKYAGQARDDGQSPIDLRTDLEDELADVLGMTLLVAKHNDIDLEEAVTRKWLQYLRVDSEEKG